MAISAINHNFGARNQLRYHFGAPHCSHCSHFQVYSLISASEHELFVGLGEGCITCSGGQLSGCWVLRWVVRRGRKCDQQKDWFNIRIYEVLRCRGVFMGCWLCIYIYTPLIMCIYNIIYIYCSMLHHVCMYVYIYIYVGLNDVPTFAMSREPPSQEQQELDWGCYPSRQ